jgi:hypothetical protein
MPMGYGGVSELRPPKGLMFIPRWHINTDSHDWTILTREKVRTRRNPPQIPHGLARASAVRGRQLTTWAMARPPLTLLRNQIVCLLLIMKHLSMSILKQAQTTIHRLVTTFRDTENVCLCKCSSYDKRAETSEVPISSSASAATTEYGHNNSILPLVSSSCVWRCSTVAIRFAF